MVQCEYLGRKFKINRNMVKSLQSVELTSELDYTEQKTAGGLPQLAIKGYKPQNTSIKYDCVAGAGVNPYDEYKAWKEKIGQAGDFYVGSDLFGVDVFTLKGVSMTSENINARGEFLAGTITLELTQDIVATTEGK